MILPVWFAAKVSILVIGNAIARGMFSALVGAGKKATNGSLVMSAGYGAAITFNRSKPRFGIQIALIITPFVVGSESRPLSARTLPCRISSYPGTHGAERVASPRSASCNHLSKHHELDILIEPLL